MCPLHMQDKKIDIYLFIMSQVLGFFGTIFKHDFKVKVEIYLIKFKTSTFAHISFHRFSSKIILDFLHL